MIVSLPVDTTSQTCSESSSVMTLDEYISKYGNTHSFKKDLDIKDDGEGKVYRYSLSKATYVKPFNSTGATHKVGDIVIKNGHHHIITEANITAGKKYKYQPEEYDYETKISSWKTWTKRYFRVHENNDMSWTVGDRVYTFYYSHCQPCKKYTWKAWDRTTNGCYSSLFECMGDKIASSYSSAKDIKGASKRWGGGGSIKEPTLIIKSAVKRGNYWYFRTYKDVAIKYHTTAGTGKYITRRIYSPKEINGFRYNRMTNCMAAFDDKNYTKAVFRPESGYVDLSFVTANSADTFAIGRVYAESVSLTARDSKNNVIFSVTDYPIANEIADTTIGQDANVILYSDKILPPKSKITIRLKAGWVSVGRILAGRKLKLGFTNTLFENGFKDFSPREQDQWGNILYKNGIRVYVHSGTVDLPLKDYDALNRAFMYIGGQEMIINSSDTTDNTPPNSLDIFQATMFIGRFTSFKQRTKNAGDVMDRVANFTFSCEESS